MHPETILYKIEGDGERKPTLKCSNGHEVVELCAFNICSNSALICDHVGCKSHSSHMYCSTIKIHKIMKMFEKKIETYQQAQDNVMLMYDSVIRLVTEEK